MSRKLVPILTFLGRVTCRRECDTRPFHNKSLYADLVLGPIEPLLDWEWRIRRRRQSNTKS